MPRPPGGRGCSHEVRPARHCDREDEHPRPPQSLGHRAGKERIAVGKIYSRFIVTMREEDPQPGIVHLSQHLGHQLGKLVPSHSQPRVMAHSSPIQNQQLETSRGLGHLSEKIAEGVTSDRASPAAALLQVEFIAEQKRFPLGRDAMRGNVEKQAIFGGHLQVSQVFRQAVHAGGFTQGQPLPPVGHLDLRHSLLKMLLQIGNVGSREVDGGRAARTIGNLQDGQMGLPGWLAPLHQQHAERDRQEESQEGEGPPRDLLSSRGTLRMPPCRSPRLTSRSLGSRVGTHDGIPHVVQASQPVISSKPLLAVFYRILPYSTVGPIGSTSTGGRKAAPPYHDTPADLRIAATPAKTARRQRTGNQVPV
jgi:hypothetical protein